ncbi:TRAP transporter small permease [Nesterenkonia muleiensis]|uniref:TRAP transporter small permease n=1 Tax=Nesterenkonia muleiensis TaxID=2282648 RepID=UPI00130075B8|nr:TRAP transporter small permease [Nesterenkonia muleiensis]
MSLIFQVIMRYVFDRPTVWSEEFATLSFVALVMAAIPIALRRHEHIALEFLLNKTPLAIRTVLNVVVALLTIGTFALLAYLAWGLLPSAERQLLTGITLAVGFDVKLSWMYATVPVGFTCAVIFGVENMIKGRQKAEEAEVLSLDDVTNIRGAV